jgi:cytochrome b6-f complex iron-sulfur subunit
MPDRRTFLKSVGLAAAAAMLPSAPAIGSGRKLALSLDRFPKLREAGGAVAVSVKGAALLVVRESESSVHAYDSTCTHQGCVVGYDAGKRRIVCPCHGSEFELDGTVVHGPARKPLPRHDAALDGERIVVTLR